MRGFARREARSMDGRNVRMSGRLDPAILLAPFRDLLDAEPGQANGEQIAREDWAALFAAAPDLAVTDADALVGLLIAALALPERALYLPAAYILHHLTGMDHGYKPFDAPEQRQVAQASWTRWWQEAAPDFRPQLATFGRSTLIVDEIPGRIVGNDDEPPGRLLLLDPAGEVAWQIARLKMPYDATRLPDGSFLVNIIRARAVWHVAPDGAVLREQPVGGYPCSQQLLPNGNLLVAGWDDDVPGFVREFDPAGQVIWSLEELRWPWKAERLANGHTLIADAGLNRVYEVDQQGTEVWAVDGLGPAEPALFDALGPIYCQRLYDGNTLVSIRGLSRIVELDPCGQVVWEVGPELVANQYYAVRLWSGNTLIADAGHFRVIEIDTQQHVIWERDGFGYPAKAYRCCLSTAYPDNS